MLKQADSTHEFAAPRLCSACTRTQICWKPFLAKVTFIISTAVSFCKVKACMCNSEPDSKNSNGKSTRTFHPSVKQRTQNNPTSTDARDYQLHPQVCVCTWTHCLPQATDTQCAPLTPSSPVSQAKPMGQDGQHPPVLRCERWQPSEEPTRTNLNTVAYTQLKGCRKLRNTQSVAERSQLETFCFQKQQIQQWHRGVSGTPSTRPTWISGDSPALPPLLHPAEQEGH